MNRRIGWLLAVAAVGWVTSALMVAPQTGHADEPCNSCKPATASWDWKANGYAIASDAAAAEKSALDKASAAACERSEGFLKSNKLSCRFGCSGGEVSTQCAPSKKPGCTQGSFADDPGMWRFVCRKMAKRGQKLDCSDERAAAEPGYGMCDVKVRMLKERSCMSPACAAPSE